MAVPRDAKPTVSPTKQEEGTVTYSQEEYESDGNHCPECGIDLSKENKQKHSILHYGEYLLPDMQHANLVARQRQAFLMGYPIPKR